MNYIDFVKKLGKTNFPFESFGVKERYLKIISLDPESEKVQAAFKRINIETEWMSDKQIISHYLKMLLGNEAEVSYDKRFYYSFYNKILGIYRDDCGICDIDDTIEDVRKKLVIYDKELGGFMDWGKDVDIWFGEQRISIFLPSKMLSWDDAWM